MRLLVTGGCGFIGVNLVRHLLQSRLANEIVVLDNQTVGSKRHLMEAIPLLQEVRPSPSSNWDKSSGNPVLFVTGDVRDFSLIEDVMSNGIDGVIHLAAQTGVVDSLRDPFQDFDVNAKGTLNLLESCRRHDVKAFVFASSNATLGEQPPPLNESNTPQPLSPYGAGKLAGEGYCSSYFRSFDIQTVCLRFTNVYGPRSYHKGSVVAQFMKRILAGQPITLYGDGRQTRDFLFVEDLCRAIVASLSRERNHIGGEKFHIGSGQETSILGLADLVRDVAQRDGFDVRIIFQPPRKGEIVRNFSDISKARTFLGFAPQVTLEEGLEQTWNWFRSHRQSLQ